GRSSAASAMEKSAVLAPIPMASVAIVNAANTGRLTSARSTYGRSCENTSGTSMWDHRLCHTSLDDAPAPNAYCRSEAPARPVVAPHEFLGDRRVRHLAGVRIQIEGLIHADGEVAEEHHLGERSGMTGEVGSGRRTALARANPLLIHAGRPRILLCRRMRCEFGLALRVEQPHRLAVAIGEQLTVAADPELRPHIGVGRPVELRRELYRPSL